MMNKYLMSILFGACIAGGLSAGAHELTPLPTRAERSVAKRTTGIVFRSVFPVLNFGLHTFSNPVHESITNMAYECPGSSLRDCADADADFASSAVLAGLRWNDDPPFKFASGQGRYTDCESGDGTVSFALRTVCWLAHFRDAEKKADADPQIFLKGSGTMLARTHFGDLQFLHSMAAMRGTSPGRTKEKIMMWAEFAWRVQSHEADHIEGKVRMGAIDIPGLRDHFPVNEERTVSDLFTLGRPWLRNQLRDVAFGSLLHMVQDSFAGGHVTRRAADFNGCSVPEIVEFHTYAGQDKAAHKERDGFTRAEASLTAGGATVVDVLRELIKLREADRSWGQVEPYFQDCVFRLAADARAASTGVSD